jgi:general stress protein YciG
MSAYHSAVDALANDAELRERVMSVTDPDERAAILREAGVDVPTQEEIDAARADLAGVTGGASTNGTSNASSVAAAAIAGSV